MEPISFKDSKGRDVSLTPYGDSRPSVYKILRGERKTYVGVVQEKDGRFFSGFERNVDDSTGKVEWRTPHHQTQKEKGFGSLQEAAQSTIDYYDEQRELDNENCEGRQLIR
jgi:hypothetical protein